jgi:isoleucyl-tRNA synthetase
MSYFKEFSSKLIKFSDNEEKILKIWEKYSICQNSVTLDVEESKASIYSFYDGPPFATGLPHYGHLTASVIKDTISRYWHMKGKYIKRCFGWDTHG